MRQAKVVDLKRVYEFSMACSLKKLRQLAEKQLLSLQIYRKNQKIKFQKYVSAATHAVKILRLPYRFVIKKKKVRRKSPSYTSKSPSHTKVSA